MSTEFKNKPIQHYLPKLVRSEREIQIISAEINKLLSKGALEVTDHSDNEIISDIFLRDKKDASHRMILNLKKLNMYEAKVHFKMDSLHTIAKLIRKDCFMASIDLKDAYYSVPISRKDRKYLRFLWQSTLFQFTCLPNGLSCAPRKFTKLLKPALSELHLRGHISSAYIDDMYLQGQTYKECVHNVIDSVTRIVWFQKKNIPPHGWFFSFYPPALEFPFQRVICGPPHPPGISIFFGGGSFFKLTASLSLNKSENSSFIFTQPLLIICCTH